MYFYQLRNVFLRWSWSREQCGHNYWEHCCGRGENRRRHARLRQRISELSIYSKILNIFEYIWITVSIFDVWTYLNIFDCFGRDTEGDMQDSVGDSLISELWISLGRKRKLQILLGGYCNPQTVNIEFGICMGLVEKLPVSMLPAQKRGRVGVGVICQTMLDDQSEGIIA